MKLSLNAMVRLKVLQYSICVYYSGLSSCYETLTLSGLRFVDRKLSLTTMVRLSIFQPCILSSFSGMFSCYETLAVHGFI